MIKGLHHISIIVSNEEGLSFYKRLGFKEVKRIERGYDSVVYLEDCGITLEIYIDPTHPPRVDRPEAMGLRHFALQVDNIEEALKAWDVLAEPIREVDGKRYTFIRDVDGLPIEIHE